MGKLGVKIILKEYAYGTFFLFLFIYLLYFPGEGWLSYNSNICPPPPLSKILHPPQHQVTSLHPLRWQWCCHTQNYCPEQLLLFKIYLFLSTPSVQVQLMISSLATWTNIVTFRCCLVPASDTVSICSSPETTVTDSQVYISSDGYPDSMPANTDQDCRCTIQTNSGRSQILDITAVHLNLYGDVTDPCRERLTLYSMFSKDTITVCPTSTPIGNSVTKINETLLSTSLNRTQPVEIQLKANRSISVQQGRFLLSIRNQGKLAYTCTSMITDWTLVNIQSIVYQGIG